MTPPSAPPMRRKKKLHTAISSTSGMIQPRISGSQRLTVSPAVFDLVRVEVFDQLRILDARGDEEVRALPALALWVAKLAVDGLVAHRRLDHLAVADERLELAVRDLAPGRREEPRLRQREQQQQPERHAQIEKAGRCGDEGSAGLQVCDREARVGPYVRRTPARRPCGRRLLRRRRR